MMKITETDTKNKKEAILDAAVYLIGSKGYAGTSLQEIANRVGIHKSTLFHYIKGKGNLLILLLEKNRKTVMSSLNTISSLSNMKPKDKLREAINNHIGVLVEHVRTLNIYLNDVKSLPKEYHNQYMLERRQYEKNFRNIVVAMQDEGYFKGLDPKIVTFGILGMLNTIPKWYKPEGPLNIQEISDTVYKMLVKK